MTYIRSHADISPCGRYRYLLEREWRGTHDPAHWKWFDAKDGAGHEMGEPMSVLFVMFNPSTADGTVDDPTIRRCVGFAKAWRYEALSVVNLFAYRATKPKDLFAAGEAVHGPRNQEVIVRAASRAGIIIAAWGAYGPWGGQNEIVRGWLSGKSIYALGLTKYGSPRHPLYISASTQPILLP